MEQTSITDRLLDKAKEAFVMAIELYNKPTIHYRLEGFSFFICNAWELMLKAHLIKNERRVLDLLLRQAQPHDFFRELRAKNFYE